MGESGGKNRRYIQEIGHAIKTFCNSSDFNNLGGKLKGIPVLHENIEKNSYMFNNRYGVDKLIGY